MKKILLISIFAMLLFAINGIASAEQVMYYNFMNDTNISIIDSSGYNNHMYNVNTVNINLNNGHHIRYYYSGAYATIAINSSFRNCINSGDNATWLMLFSTNGSLNTQYLIRDSSTAKSIYISTDGYIKADLRYTNGTYIYNQNSNLKPSNNTWYYLIVRYNGTSLFYNLIDLNGTWYNGTTCNINGALYNDTSNNFSLSYSTNNFLGYCGAFRLYNTSLTNNEIISVYNVDRTVISDNIIHSYNTQYGNPIIYYVAVMSIPMLAIWIILGFLAFKYDSFLLKLFFLFYNLALLIDCMNCVDRGTLDIIILFGAFIFSAFLCLNTEYINT